MTESEIEIGAHLGSLRFVLEVVLASAFAGQPTKVVDAMVAEMKQKSRTALVRQPFDGDMAMAQRGAELIGSLLDGAVARSRGQR